MHPSIFSDIYQGWPRSCPVTICGKRGYLQPMPQISPIPVQGMVKLSWNHPTPCLWPHNDSFPCKSGQGLGPPLICCWPELYMNCDSQLNTLCPNHPTDLLCRNSLKYNWAIYWILSGWARHWRGICFVSLLYSNYCSSYHCIRG